MTARFSGVAPMFAVGLTSLGGKFDQVLGVIFNGQVVEDLYACQVSRFFL